MTTEITMDRVRALLPARPPEAHKGKFGHVYILAGSRGFTGAAKLACEAAGRSGVGLVTVGVPQPLGDVVAAGLLEAMSMLLPATGTESFARGALEPALEFASNKQAVVLGPGISQDPETRDFVLGFVERCPVPLLVDADGLNCLGANPDVLRSAAGPRVLTPHPGEMARLTGKTSAEVQSARERTAAEFASHYGCALVLKGHRTVVASVSGEVCVNPTGNSGLATGGTGDVLSGLIGGLMAQRITPFDAALVGVYLHGLAGDIAAERMTKRALIARDVLGALPEAWRRVEAGTPA